MDDLDQRTTLLIGTRGVQKLHASTVAVFGMGGVGSFAAEALARSGVGRLILVDHDRIVESNLNRQLPATQGTLGQLKVMAMKQRLLSIRTDLEIVAAATFWAPDLAEAEKIHLLPPFVDHVIDAIDTVPAKIDLAVWCRQQNLPLISSMGAGNKLDPSRLEVTDLYKTHACPLARVMRRELKKKGVTKLPVVFSPETPSRAVPGREPASMVFVPGSAGLLLASKVVRDLLAEPL